MPFPSLLGNAVSMESLDLALYLQNMVRARLASCTERSCWIQIRDRFIKEFIQAGCPPFMGQGRMVGALLCITSWLQFSGWEVAGLWLPSGLWNELGSQSRIHRQVPRFKARAWGGAWSQRANCEVPRYVTGAAWFASRHFPLTNAVILILSLCLLTVVGRRWARKIFRIINHVVVDARCWAWTWDFQLWMSWIIGNCPLWLWTETLRGRQSTSVLSLPPNMKVFSTMLLFNGHSVLQSSCGQSPHLWASTYLSILLFQQTSIALHSELRHKI